MSQKISDTMKAPIPKNRMELKHFPKDFDLDLALVILFTLLCIQTFSYEEKLYQQLFFGKESLTKETRFSFSTGFLL